MDDLTLVLTLFKDRPWIVVAIFIIFAKEIIEIIQKYVVPLFRKKKSVEQMLAEDAEERKARQAEVDRKFIELETGLNEVKNAVSAIEDFSGKISEGTLTNQLFNDSLWPFLRLKAFRRLLAMRKNGRIWDKGLSIIVSNKDTKNKVDPWLDVLETDLGIPIMDVAYYDNKLAEIKRRVYDDFSGK